MKKRDIQILLAVFGVLIAFASWKFVFEKNQAKAAQIEAENVDLQQQVDRLEELDAKKDEYIADTEKLKEQCNELAQAFPSGLRLEDVVMYLYNMELVGTNDTKVAAIDFEELSEIPYEGTTTTEDGFELHDDGIRLWDLFTTVSVKTTGNGVKNMIDYIYAMPGRKSIEKVELEINDLGYLEGSIEANFFSMTGTDVPYVEVNIPTMPMGTTNIWRVVTGSARTELVDEDGNPIDDAEGEESEESEDEE